MNWIDSTPYSRAKKGKIDPYVFVITFGDITVTIISRHTYYHNTWIVNCHSLGIERKIIGPTKEFTAEQAQKKAIEIVRARFNHISACLKEL